MRSIRQTFRRPQLMAPIIVFPTLLLAIQTGGAGGAVNLPGFPPVQSFLQFMLAGAMMQSLMLAGNSGGIALAVDIEMGFTDRLFSAPIPRFTIVLGRLAGTAALGLFGSLWFLAIGLIFGAEIEGGVAGRADRDRPGHRRGDGGRRDRRRDRPAHRQRQRRPGPLPAGPRRPLPLLRLLPPGTDDRAGARRSPSTTRSASSSKASASRSSPGSTPPTRCEAVLAIARHRRRSGSCSAPAPCATGCGWADGVGSRPCRLARQPGDDRGADGAGQERAAAGARRGDPRRAGADDLLPRPQRRLRRPDPAQRLQHRHATRASSSRSACCRGPASPAPRPGVNLARDIEQGWLDRLLVSPAPRWVLLAGTVLAASARALIPATFVFIIALLLGAGWPGIDGLLVTYFMVAAMAAVAACWGSLPGAALQEPVGGAADAGGDDGADPDHHRLRAAGAAAAAGCRQVAEVNPVTQVIEAAMIAGAERRGFRQMIAVIGDSANIASIELHRARGFPHRRHLRECRLQVRPLARQRADAAHARRRRDQPRRRAIPPPARATCRSRAARGRVRGRGARSGRWRRSRCRRPGGAPACGFFSMR